jgi:predicted dehydrogenase
VLTYENRQANANPLFGRSHGIEFHGTEGTLHLDRTGFEVFPEKRKKDDREVARTASIRMEQIDDGLHNHVGNFLECVKSRQKPICDIESGHQSSAACLLGNVALRTRERIDFDPLKQELVNPTPSAKKLFGREYRAPWKLPA